MSYKHLIIDKKDNIASIILNRPQMMNAMSKEMILGLRDAVLEIGSDEGIRVLIIKGAGDHFCSGADLNLFTENTASYEWITAMKGVGQIVKTIREMPQPVITMLNGVAVGGGANLALAADFVIAAENARFCEIFINIGAIMDYGGHYFLPRLVGLTKARELAMLGDEIDGNTAASIGLIYKSVPQEELEKETANLFYDAFGDSSINFVVQFWIPFKKWADYLSAKDNAIMAIKNAYDQHDITIPFPIRTLDFGIKGSVPMKEMLER